MEPEKGDCDETTTTTTTSVNNNGTTVSSASPLVIRKKGLPKTLAFREVGPTDLETCYAMEKGSYPADEAASKSTLQYRQHHAAKYFRCATVSSMKEEENDDDDGDDTVDNNNNNSQNLLKHHGSSGSAGGEEQVVIGYICSTRCHDFTAESMTQHSTNGPLLAIHSVVVHPDYKRRGIASAMLQDYIRFILQDQQQQPQEDTTASTTTTTTTESSSASSSSSSGGSTQPGIMIKSSSNSSLTTLANTPATSNPASSNKPPIEKIVLLSKQNLLTFYIHAGGFSVTRPSPIVHGSETWYELEKVVFVPQPTATAAGPRRPRCFVVDAFCDAQKRGTGNPAAIVLLDETTTTTAPIPSTAAVADHDGTMIMTVETARWMQTVAQEFNLAETAFVWPVAKATAEAAATETNGGGDVGDNEKKQEAQYYIRYFTPTMEVNLCGHATLAAASILFQFSSADTSAAAAAVAHDATIVFHARQDVLRANLAPITTTTTTAAAAATTTSSTTEVPAAPGTRPTRITMEFPSKPAVEITSEDDIAAIKAMLTSAFDIHCHPEHEEDDYSEDEGEESSNIRFLGLAPPDIGDLLVELTPACFQQVGGYHGTSRRRQRSPPASIQTEQTKTTMTTSASSLVSDDEQDEALQRPIRYNELLSWNGYSRGVILCCEAAWKHETATDDSNVNGSQSGDGNIDNAAADAAPQADFQSRFFAPKAGINEDPVTGSAHCILAPHFFQRLRTKTTKTTLIGHQQSPRGGFVECSMIYAKGENETQESLSLDGDDYTSPTQEQGEGGEKQRQDQEGSNTANEDRVRITGTTVVTMVGELY